MKKAILLSAMLLTGPVMAGNLVPAWEVDGFKMPESVVYDAARDKYYVSNVNAGVMERDGNGSVGVIQANGVDHIVDWVSGLSSPKGMDLRGNLLFVADVGELVVINVDKAQIVARYPAPESKVLNGLAISPEGDVYVSDWKGDRIYKLVDQELQPWLDSPNLESPNGLFVDGGYLYVCAWGKDPQADFSTLSSGKLKRIALGTKKIEDLNNGTPWMNLDGIHRLGKDRWMATDFMKGELLRFDAKGALVDTYKLAPSAADFYFVEQKNLVVVPYLMANKVIAYQVSTN